MIELEKRLGYAFNDENLVVAALTHSSYANENRKSGAVCNERLEFLGDAVLGFTVAGYLYKRYGDMPEGKMTRLRAEMVCENSLAETADKLCLGRYILLGHGEELSGGRERKSILADAVEAVIAAIYLDGGMEPAADMIMRYIIEPYEKGIRADIADYKTSLQERLQRESGHSIKYRLEKESGPDHDKRFEVSVFIDGTESGRGTGRSKKEAEQAAAENALEVYGK